MTTNNNTNTNTDTNIINSQLNEMEIEKESITKENYDFEIEKNEDVNNEENSDISDIDEIEGKIWLILIIHRSKSERRSSYSKIKNVS